MLILDVSIIHGNTTGEKLTQHSALKGHSAVLHSEQVLCGPWECLPSFQVFLWKLPLLPTSASTASAGGEAGVLAAFLAPCLQPQLVLKRGAPVHTELCCCSSPVTSLMGKQLRKTNAFKLELYVLHIQNHCQLRNTFSLTKNQPFWFFHSFSICKKKKNFKKRKKIFLPASSCIWLLCSGFLQVSFSRD